MRSRATAALALLAAVALVAGVTVAGLRWWSTPQTDSGSPTAAATEPAAASPGPDSAGSDPDAAAPSSTAERARIGPVVVRRAPATPTPAPAVNPPVRVRMEAIDLDARVRPVGVDTDRQMELPDEPWVLGWYRFGPAPGAGTGTGSAVLAGHLDSRRYGVGPLVGLRNAEEGDRVTVTVEGGTTLTYRVVLVERFDQQRLPAALFARTGPERLRIITCGGAFDPESGYEENLVVTAVPV